METQITPRFVERKQSKAGKTYFQCEAIDGQKYTLHEAEIEKQLSANIGKPVLVQVEISGDWKNIRKFIGSGNIQAEKVESKEEYNKGYTKAMAEIEPKSGYKLKDAAMLTAYAKDLSIAMLQKSKRETFEKEDIANIVREAGAMIIELYNDILSAI